MTSQWGILSAVLATVNGWTIDLSRIVYGYAKPTQTFLYSRRYPGMMFQIDWEFAHEQPETSSGVAWTFLRTTVGFGWFILGTDIKAEAIVQPSVESNDLYFVGHAEFPKRFGLHRWESPAAPPIHTLCTSLVGPNMTSMMTRVCAATLCGAEVYYTLGDRAAKEAYPQIWSLSLNDSVSSTPMLRVDKLTRNALSSSHDLIFCGNSLILVDARPPSVMPGSQMSYTWVWNRNNKGGSLTLEPGVFSDEVMECEIQLAIVHDQVFLLRTMDRVDIHYDRVCLERLDKTHHRWEWWLNVELPPRVAESSHWECALVRCQSRLFVCWFNPLTGVCLEFQEIMGGWLTQNEYPPVVRSIHRCFYNDYDPEGISSCSALDPTLFL